MRRSWEWRASRRSWARTGEASSTTSAALVDGAADARLEVAEVGDALGDLRQQRELHAQPRERIGDAAGGVEGGLDVEQLGGLQDVAAGGLTDAGGDVAGGGEARGWA